MTVANGKKTMALCHFTFLFLTNKTDDMLTDNL